MIAMKNDTGATVVAFVNCLYEPGDLIELRLCGDGKRPLRRWCHAGEIDKHLAWLKTENARGYNVYFGANPRSREGGTRRDVACSRAVFVDLDNVTLNEARDRLRDTDLPAPTTVVLSGGGAHFWWRLVEPLTDLGQWTRLQKGAIVAMRSDPAIHDAPRIMRLPGFINTKPSRNGAACTLVEMHPDRAYDPCEFPEIKPERDNGHEPAQAVTGKIEAGGRHAALVSLCGTLRNRGLETDAIESMLQAFNQSQCDPPKPDAEVDSIARWKPEQGNGKADNGQGVTSSAAIRPLSEYQPRRVPWLWPDRIPSSMLTVIASDPGCGKSTLVLDIASRLSRGTAWPDRRDEPIEAGSTILATGEDGIADTVRPRVDAAGGDPGRIHILRGITRSDDDEPGAFHVDQHLHHLEDAISDRPDVKLVVLDPMDVFLSDAVDTHHKAEVQRVLGSLNGLAERRRIAVVGVLHLRKSGGDSAAIYRIMGSLGWVSSPRMVWGITRDKDDRRRRLMLPIKCNVCPEPDGLAFTIEDHGGVGCVHWEDGPIHTSADEAFGSAKPRTRSARDDATEWLTMALANGPVSSDELRELAEAEGLSWSTIKRAKAELGVRACRSAAGWAWRLETQEDQPGG